MATVDIQITNLPQIKRAFNKSPTVMSQELNLAIKKVALTIQGKESLEYRSLGIRVITSGLINSIRRGLYFSNLKGEVGPNVTGSPGVSYAVYVHSGTRYMRARPFLLNAVNESQLLTDKYFKDAVQNTLDKIGSAT